MKKFLLTCVAVLGFATFASAETATYTYSEQGFTNAQALETITHQGVEVSYSKGSNPSNAPKYYNTGNAGRLYGGNTITFTVADGATITDIAFTVASSYPFNEASTASEGTFDAAAATWTGSAQTVTITQGGTSGHVRISSWTLTYTLGEAPKVARPEISCTDNKVTITVEGGATAYYTLDGTVPTKASTPYTAPFAITANTTVKAIAAKGDDVSGVTTFNAKYVGTYANFAAIVAAGDGTEGTVSGPITGIYKNGYNLYTVDANGGFMLLYDTGSFAGLTDFANGDTFASVTGKYAARYNELTNVTLGTKTAGTAVQPEVLTVEEISADMVNKYVKIVNVTIADGEKANNYTMTDATGAITLYNTFNSADKYTVVDVPKGEGFTVTGFVGLYNNNPQITPIRFEGGQVMETVATPVFSVAAGAVTAGTTVEITSATAGAAIFYTLDGTEPGASSTQYNGAITISDAMTIKAIALKEGMLNSEVATASYTILDPTASVATFDFTNPSTLTPSVDTPTAEATETDLSNMTLTNNAVSITFSGKEGANTAPRLWFNKNYGIDMRIYKPQYFTVSVAKGYILSNIRFTHYDKGKLVGLDCGTVGTYDVNPDNTKEAIWTAPAETERKVAAVTFNATASSQITTLTVSYKEGEAGVENIAVDVESAPAVYYNLQGVRVDNPAPGNLYIVRRGNTVTKTIVR